MLQSAYRNKKEDFCRKHYTHYKKGSTLVEIHRHFVEVSWKWILISEGYHNGKSDGFSHVPSETTTTKTTRWLLFMAMIESPLLINPISSIWICLRNTILLKWAKPCECEHIDVLCGIWHDCNHLVCSNRIVLSKWLCWLISNGLVNRHQCHLLNYSRTKLFSY